MIKSSPSFKFATVYGSFAFLGPDTLKQTLEITYVLLFFITSIEILQQQEVTHWKNSGHTDRLLLQAPPQLGRLIGQFCNSIHVEMDRQSRR